MDIRDLPKVGEPPITINLGPTPMATVVWVVQLSQLNFAGEFWPDGAKQTLPDGSTVPVTGKIIKTYR